MKNILDKYGIPKMGTKKDLFDFLVKNNHKLISQKKAEIKELHEGVPVLTKGNNQNKAEFADKNELKATLVINTTNIFDSHGDVHIEGLWKKTLQEQKNTMLLQEHIKKFNHIIADGKDVKAYTEKTTFRELGFDIDGTTQALIFDATIKKSRNEFMFNQYANGWVSNHSVGMYYMKMKLAINSQDYEEEYKVWQAHYDSIANKEEVNEAGFFWAIYEAKLIEGSAVPVGSNIYTPIIEMKTNNEPEQSTQQNNDTQTEPSIYKQLLKHL